MMVSIFHLIFNSQIADFAMIHRDICIILHMEQLIHMKKFDLIVIGSGSGMKIVWSAVNDGLMSHWWKAVPWAGRA